MTFRARTELYGKVREYGETTGTNGTSRLPRNRVGNAARRLFSPREAVRPDCQGGCRGFKSLHPLSSLKPKAVPSASALLDSSALLDAVTEADIRAVAKALVKRARDGEVPAVRELLDRLLGRPGDVQDLAAPTMRDHRGATQRGRGRRLSLSGKRSPPLPAGHRRTNNRQAHPPPKKGTESRTARGSRCERTVRPWSGVDQGQRAVRRRDALPRGVAPVGQQRGKVRAVHLLVKVDVAAVGEALGGVGEDGP